MRTTISTTIDIDASRASVWAVLTDFADYRDWNPFMDRIEGRPEVGARLVVHLSPPGGRGMTFKPTVLAATPGEELRWLGKLLVGGIFDGEHSFVLSTNPNGSTRLVHSETFSGLLVALARGVVSSSHAGFDDFNQALKDRVETTRLPR